MNTIIIGDTSLSLKKETFTDYKTSELVYAVNFKISEKMTNKESNILLSVQDFQMFASFVHSFCKYKVEEKNNK